MLHLICFILLSFIPALNVVVLCFVSMFILLKLETDFWSMQNWRSKHLKVTSFYIFIFCQFFCLNYLLQYTFKIVVNTIEGDFTYIVQKVVKDVLLLLQYKSNLLCS